MRSEEQGNQAAKRKQAHLYVRAKCSDVKNGKEFGYTVTLQMVSGRSKGSDSSVELYLIKGLYSISKHCMSTI